MNNLFQHRRGEEVGWSLARVLAFTAKPGEKNNKKPRGLVHDVLLYPKVSKKRVS